jgi:hypothetical protein
MIEQLRAKLFAEMEYWRERIMEATEKRLWVGQSRWMKITHHAHTVEATALDCLKQAERARLAEDWETASIYRERAVRHLSTVWFDWDCALVEIAGQTPMSGFPVTKANQEAQGGETPQTLTLEQHQRVGELLQHVYQIRAHLLSVQMEINQHQQETILAFLEPSETGEVTERREDPDE